VINSLLSSPQPLLGSSYVGSLHHQKLKHNDLNETSESRLNNVFSKNHSHSHSLHHNAKINSNSSNAVKK
jgi:hypothetical protein